jgi:transcriptional regulator with XRE-family HTH domain
MERNFSAVLSELRRSRGLSQRSASADLGISQALLSHYENGAREPGLNFVCRACDYYGVSADYLLGRTSVADRYDDNLERIGNFVAELRALVDQAEKFTEGHGK